MLLLRFRLLSASDHDHGYVDAGEGDEEQGEEHEADQVEPGHVLVPALLTSQSDVDVAVVVVVVLWMGVEPTAPAVDNGYVLPQVMDLQSKQDDRILEERAEDEEYAGDDPGLNQE